MARGSRPNVPPQVCEQCGAPVPQPRVMLTPAEAAERAAVGVDKVYEWTRTRGFPVLSEGPRMRRINAALFDKWLAARSV